MNSREFANAWLEQNGLFSKESDYDGWLGECVLKAWEFIADQGHSGGSMSRLIDLLNKIYQAYEQPNHPLWRSYWHSEEGRASIAKFQGKATATDEDVDAAIALMVALPQKE